MKMIILLSISLLSVLYLVSSISAFTANYNGATENFPKLFKNKTFLIITGFSTILLIVFFIMGSLMWNQPIQKFELVTEPLYRLK